MDDPLRKSIPLVYRNIHQRIVERKGRRICHIPIHQEKIQRRDICLFIKDLGIPTELTQGVMEEMEYYGLLRIKDKKTIEILNGKGQ